MIMFHQWHFLSPVDVIESLHFIIIHNMWHVDYYWMIFTCTLVLDLWYRRYILHGEAISAWSLLSHRWRVFLWYIANKLHVEIHTVVCSVGWHLYSAEWKFSWGLSKSMGRPETHWRKETVFTCPSDDLTSAKWTTEVRNLYHCPCLYVGAAESFWKNGELGEQVVGKSLSREDRDSFLQIFANGKRRRMKFQDADWQHMD